MVSEAVYVNYGIPQDIGLIPFLFVIYTDDVFTATMIGETFSRVDDIVVL